MRPNREVLLHLGLTIGGLVLVLFYLLDTVPLSAGPRVVTGPPGFVLQTPRYVLVVLGLLGFFIVRYLVVVRPRPKGGNRSILMRSRYPHIRRCLRAGRAVVPPAVVFAVLWAVLTFAVFLVFVAMGTDWTWGMDVQAFFVPLLMLYIVIAAVAWSGTRIVMVRWLPDEPFTQEVFLR